jgi:hypothetical protein
MASYIVAPGRIITRGSQPPLREGMPVTADVLAEWGAAGLAANVEIGAVLGVGAESTEPPESRRARR